MFFFTETLNVSRPVMDCLDQIQRAGGMVSEGRKAFSAMRPHEPRERCACPNARAKSFGTMARGCCHMSIVTFMGRVTLVSMELPAGSDEAWVLAPVGIAG